MNAFALFALLWIPVSLGLVMLFAFNVGRIEKMFEGRNRNRFGG